MWHAPGKLDRGELENSSVAVLAGRRLGMKKSRFSEQQIAFVLRQAEEGTAIAEVCRKAGISEASFYAWRRKYGGLLPSEMKRLKQLDEENRRLKKLVADLSLDKIAETRVRYGYRKRRYQVMAVSST